MPGPYALIGNQATVSGANKTALILTGAATVAPKITDFTVSASGTPADNVLFWDVQRSTAAGTSTAVTPRSAAYSPGIVTPIASLVTGGSNATVEPTYTASNELWKQGINQRAAYRWVAAPGFELVIPAVANAGIGWALLSTGYTGQADVSAMWIE